MATVTERIATLETHRGHDADLLGRVDGRLEQVETKIDDIHKGMRFFILAAKTLAAVGVLLGFFKGVSSWHDVTDAFGGI